MPTIRIPPVGSYTNRNPDPANTSTKGQQFINSYPEVTENPITQKSDVGLYKRPGYAKTTELSGVTSVATPGAILAWTGSSSVSLPIPATFVVAGGSSTSVWDLNVPAKVGGDVPNTSAITCLTETRINAVPHLVGNFVDSANSVIEQWYFPEGGAWTQVTSACLTSNTISTQIVGTPVHLDGYVFNMMKDGKVRNSDLNTVSAYQANNFISASAYPDNGVTVARLGQYVMAFGQNSIEPMVNAGNAAGSPLSRVGNATIQLGAVAYNSSEPPTVIEAFGTIYWVATNREGAASGVYRFDGLKPAKISTPSIDRLLQAQILRGFAGTMILHGMRHVLLTNPSASVTRQYAYCLETNYWWQMSLASGAVRACTAIDSANNGSAQTWFIGTNNARGNFISPGSTVYQDDGSTYTMTVQTDNVDAGTERKKFWRKLRIDYDRQASTSPITVYASDDDHASYQTLGTIDTVSSNAQNWISRLGASRNRSWKLEHSASTACHIRIVEIDYEKGTS